MPEAVYPRALHSCLLKALSLLVGCYVQLKPSQVLCGLNWSSKFQHTAPKILIHKFPLR